MAESETQELGGQIALTGFKGMDGGNMIIAKKMVGNFVKDLSKRKQGFSGLALTLRTIRERETSELYEIKARLSFDREYNAEVTDRNFLFAVDKVLKKLESQLG